MVLPEAVTGLNRTPEQLGLETKNHHPLVSAIKGFVKKSTIVQAEYATLAIVFGLISADCTQVDIIDKEHFGPVTPTAAVGGSIDNTLPEVSVSPIIRETKTVVPPTPTETPIPATETPIPATATKEPAVPTATQKPIVENTPNINSELLKVNEVQGGWLVTKDDEIKKGKLLLYPASETKIIAAYTMAEDIDKPATTKKWEWYYVITKGATDKTFRATGANGRQLTISIVKNALIIELKDNIANSLQTMKVLSMSPEGSGSKALGQAWINAHQQTFGSPFFQNTDQALEDIEQFTSFKITRD